MLIGSIINTLVKEYMELHTNDTKRPKALPTWLMTNIIRYNTKYEQFS